jgi:hypothetical protein
MCWYAFVSILAEILYHLRPLFAHVGPYSVFWARVLMYLALTTFIVFARACAVLRRYESDRMSGPVGGK